MMFSLRSGRVACEAAAAALVLSIPLHLGSPARADAATANGNDAVGTGATCIARVGRPVSCQVGDSRAFNTEGTTEATPEATETAGLPPGLELTADGRIAGTPTQAGISTVSLGGTGIPISIPVVVSDVDYLAVTLSADGKRLHGTRWDGSHVMLHDGLVGSDVRGLGVHPNGSVYLLTVRTLVRIERPGQVSVVLDGLEAEAIDITARGDIHVASRNEILTVQSDGRVLQRARGAKVMDVLEDDNGDLWTVEWGIGVRHLRHIDVETGVVREQAAGYDPTSVATNRGWIYVTTRPALGEDDRVIAIDDRGATTTLLDEPHRRLEYSDAFGLLATDGKLSSQLAWAGPLQRRQLADPVFHRVAVADHLRFTGAAPTRALFEDYRIVSGRITPGDPIGPALRSAYDTTTAVVWSMPAGVPQHGVSITPDGVLTAVDAIPIGRHTVIVHALVHGVVHAVPVIVDCRAA